MSDGPLRAWPAFSARVLARLEAGRREYPDSPDRPELALLDEIQQELEDVCGWSTVLWSKLERLRERVTGAERAQPESDAREGQLSAKTSSAFAPCARGRGRGAP